MAEKKVEKKLKNGVNVDALLAAREALKQAPQAAKFKWRASCKWQTGTHSSTKVKGFHGLGEEQKHKTEFTFSADHPEVFASEDLGATPVELVLVGLASCLTAGVAAVAQNRGIQLRSVEARLEGSMDRSERQRLMARPAWPAPMTTVVIESMTATPLRP